MNLGPKLSVHVSLDDEDGVALTDDVVGLVVDVVGLVVSGADVVLIDDWVVSGDDVVGSDEALVVTAISSGIGDVATRTTRRRGGGC